MSNSVTYLNVVPMFEWCVVRCGSKNGDQRDLCFKEIELIVSDTITTLSIEEPL